MQNKLFYAIIAIIVIHIIALFVILDYKQQQIEEQKFNEMWNDMTTPDISTDTINVNAMSQANMTIGDSIVFEYYASLCTVVDMPEEHPSTGDTLCAYISNDTMYVQHYHQDNDEQLHMFRYRHNY